MTFTELQSKLEWHVILATDHDEREFTVFALNRDSAIAVARSKWGAGSAWTFVKEVEPMRAF